MLGILEWFSLRPTHKVNCRLGFTLYNLRSTQWLKFALSLEKWSPRCFWATTWWRWRCQWHRTITNIVAIRLFQKREESWTFSCFGHVWVIHKLQNHRKAFPRNFGIPRSLDLCFICVWCRCIKAISYGISINIIMGWKEREDLCTRVQVHKRANHAYFNFGPWEIEMKFS